METLHSKIVSESQPRMVKISAGLNFAIFNAHRTHCTGSQFAKQSVLIFTGRSCTDILWAVLSVYTVLYVLYTYSLNGFLLIFTEPCCTDLN